MRHSAGQHRSIRQSGCTMSRTRGRGGRSLATLAPCVPLGGSQLAVPSCPSGSRAVAVTSQFNRRTAVLCFRQSGYAAGAATLSTLRARAPAAPQWRPTCIGWALPVRSCKTSTDFEVRIHEFKEKFHQKFRAPRTPSDLAQRARTCADRSTQGCPAGGGAQLVR